MLHAEILISETGEEPIAPQTVWHRLRELTRSEAKLRQLRAAFGERSLRRFQAVGTALQLADFRDAVHVFVGEQLVFNDPRNAGDDLTQALEKTAESDALSRDFSALRFVVAHLDEHLHVLCDVEMAGRLRGDRPEIRFRLAGRDRRLFIQRGESPSDYRDRVLGVARSAEEPDAILQRFDEVVDGLRAAVEPRIPGAEITCSAGVARLIRPGPLQLGRFRDLGFLNSVRPPTYRSKPTHKRKGAYDSPFYYYFFDPYQDLLNWFLIDDMVRNGTWTDPRVEVVARSGERLFAGARAQSHASDAYELPWSTVKLGPRGIEVADSVPYVTSMDPVEVGSPYTPGFGGEGAG